MKIKIMFFMCAVFFFQYNLCCQFVCVSPSSAEPAPAAAAAAIQVVPTDNLFEFIFGIPQDRFLAMMPLTLEGSQDPLLMLSTDHVFDVRSRRFFLTTSTGNYGCGRCELLSYHELAALNRLRFERFLSGGLSSRAGHFHVVEAIGIDETSPFWHRVDIAALMTSAGNRGAVFQLFECDSDDVGVLSPSCMATLPACMYRRFFNGGSPAAHSLLYQHGVQVVYGRSEGDGRVCVREQSQIVDLAVCHAAFDLADEHLANWVAATYRAVLQAAFIKEKWHLICVVPPNLECNYVAQALMALKQLIIASNVEVMLLWHNDGEEENEEEARSVLVDLVNQIDGAYTQYRPDGMYQLCDDSPPSPGTPSTPPSSGFM